MATKKSKATAINKTPKEDIGRDGEGKPAESVLMRGVICPRCGSSERTRFLRREMVRDFDSIMFEPKLKVRFNRIIYRNCNCKQCGQAMRVREFTMKPEKPSPMARR